MRTYIFTYGSQLHFLAAVNIAAVVTKEQAKKQYFDPVANAHSDFYAGEDAFDKWLHHLTVNEFVKVEDTKLVIAPTVREFLAFSANNGLSLNNQHWWIIEF